MRGLEKTIVILAFLALLSQTIRHAYMLWFESRESVLDKYEKPRKGEIEAAKSLDELVRRYEPIRKQVDQLREERAKAENATGEDQSARGKARPLEDTRIEPFKSEQELRQAINEWEEKANEIRELRFFWTIGLVFLILGMVIYRKLNRWVGLTLIIAGLAEFIYWTSPTFFGGTHEFDRLLWNKLVLTIVSLILLLLVIWFNRVFADREPSAA